MSERALFVVRHGATEWSKSGQHTGRTDLPLLPEGREKAATLAPVLAPITFSRVLCSPRQRARTTCELAGFGDRMEIIDDLAEWDYGDYEGLTSDQIHRDRPDWLIWRDGCPGGESPEQIAARADRVIDAALSGSGSEDPVILFGHGHILRVVALRWLGFAMEAGLRFALSPATISKLGHEHADRALEIWNADSVS
jgi:broad specificity phosphatase PhoE